MEKLKNLLDYLIKRIRADIITTATTSVNLLFKKSLNVCGPTLNETKWIMRFAFRNLDKSQVIGYTIYYKKISNFSFVSVH